MGGLRTFTGIQVSGNLRVQERWDLEEVPAARDLVTRALTNGQDSSTPNHVIFPENGPNNVPHITIKAALDPTNS